MYRFLNEHRFPFSGIKLKNVIARYMVQCLVLFKKLPNSPPEWLYNFLLPPANKWMNQFFHIFATTWHCCYFLIFAILVGIEDILLAFEHRGFLGSSNGKQSACNAGDLGLVSGLGRSPGEGHGNLLQYSCLENPTKEAGRLQSMGSQRVGHDWVTIHST